jgi:hypothetical protein
MCVREIGCGRLCRYSNPIGGARWVSITRRRLAVVCASVSVHLYDNKKHGTIILPRAFLAARCLDRPKLVCQSDPSVVLQPRPVPRLCLNMLKQSTAAAGLVIFFINTSFQHSTPAPLLHPTNSNQPPLKRCFNRRGSPHQASRLEGERTS